MLKRALRQTGIWIQKSLQTFWRWIRHVAVSWPKAFAAVIVVMVLSYYPLGGEKREIAVGVSSDAGTGVEEVKVASGYTQEIIDFAKNILGEKVELPGVQDGFNSIRIALGMIESVRTKQVYRF